MLNVSQPTVMPVIHDFERQRRSELANSPLLALDQLACENW
jgi:hypothetical protein